MAGRPGIVERLRRRARQHRAIASPELARLFPSKSTWHAEAADEADEAAAAIEDALTLAEALRNEPHGCRFCDSGVLRTPDDPRKGHDEDCAWTALAAFDDAASGSFDATWQAMRDDGAVR